MTLWTIGYKKTACIAIIQNYEEEAHQAPQQEHSSIILVIYAVVVLLTNMGTHLFPWSSWSSLVHCYLPLL